MLIASLRSLRAEPDDQQRDWRGMAWAACGDSWVSTSGGWAHRAILTPVARARRGDGRQAAGDEWTVLIDGTPCQTADGTAMAWPDRLRAGCQAHELLHLGFQGPAVRARTPWRLMPRADLLLPRCIPCAPTRGRHGHDGSCRRREHCIRPSLEADRAAEGLGTVIMNSELTMALQTIGDRACFDNKEAARHAYRSEVARWLCLT